MAKGKSAKEQRETKGGSGAAASQPRTSTVVRWSPDKIAQAAALADLGNFALMGALCEVIMADDRVTQALDRLYSATTLPLSFLLPGKNSEESKKDKICIAADDDWWRMLPEGTAREVVRWLALTNLCLIHIDSWELNEETGRVLPKLTVWSLRHLRNDADKGWMVRVCRGNSWATEEIELDLESGNWALLINGSSWTVATNAPWRGISPWWLVKAYAAVDWPASSERHGDAATVLTNKSETILYTDTQRDKLVKLIKNGGRGRVVALPDGFEASLLLDTANTWTTFKAQVEVANLAISLALVGTNLTSEVSGGSYAAASVHQSVDTSKFRGLLDGLSTGFREKVLVFWGRYNFGNGAIVPYPTWDTTPPDDKKLKADTQVQASTAALNWQKAGFKLSRKATAQQWGLVEAESKDDELVPVQTAQTSGFTQGFGAAKEAARAQGATKEPGTAFERGRGYIDSLESSCCAHAAKELAPTLAAVLSAIEDGTSYEDVKERIAAAYRDELPPSKLLKLTEAALIMGQLAGRETVEQELNTEE